MNVIPKININYDNKETKNNFLVFKEDIKLNLLDILCYSKNSHKKKDIELYKLGDSFYRKRMDIVFVFSHIGRTLYTCSPFLF